MILTVTNYFDFLFHTKIQVCSSFGYLQIEKKLFSKERSTEQT